MESEDPLDWDVGRLIRELCTSEKSWIAPSQKKLPDPASLKDALTEHDLDGETLLTYEDQGGGRQAFDSLCKDLGIHRIPQKASFRNAITQFQSRSAKYRRLKQLEASANLDSLSTSVSIPHAFPPDNNLPHGNAPSGSGGDANRLSRVSIGVQSSPPKKKRRLAQADLFVDASIPFRCHKILTEADGFLHPQQLEHDHELATASIPGDATTENASPAQDHSTWLGYGGPRTYLGRRSLTKDSILNGNPYHWHSDAETCPKRYGFPPGRILQVYQIMARHVLLPEAPTPKLGRGPYLPNEGVETLDDEILTLFGDSETDDAEYDSETYREMEEEEVERVNRETHFTEAQIDSIVSEVIQGHEQKWTTKKLPRLEQDAYQMWHNARHQGKRQHEIDRAADRIKEFDNRIEKYRQEFLKTYCDARSIKQLEKGAEIFQQTVEDKMRATWIRHTLSLETPPAKPSNARPAKVAATPTTGTELDEDEEILTSSADENESDWIVDDGTDFETGANFEAEKLDGAREVDKAKQVGSFSADYHSPQQDFIPGHDAKKRTPTISSTASPPPTAPKTRNRTTASTTTSMLGRSKPIPLGDIAAIAAEGRQHWREQRDSLRYLVTVLDETSPALRRRVFNYLPHGPEWIWNTLCRRAIERGREIDDLKTTSPIPAEEDIGVFYSRLFYAFIQCSWKSTIPFYPLKEKIVQRLEDGFRSNDMNRFCDSLERVQAFFLEPTPELEGPAFQETEASASHAEKSDYGREDDGNEEDEDEDEEPQDTFSKRQKRKVKRDQAAQSLRKKDLARAKAQEERKKIFRARLAQSNFISDAESRLIINEAKDENDGLVYINTFISGRIKDHQIDGVRFMWNHIVTDATSRQGCLLAHTMGLGKTMQVITLLVSIAEAASSKDPAIFKQIPSDIRQSKTLVICPASLVTNWVDEFSKWAPNGVIGDVFEIIASELDVEERRATILNWDEAGGVLVIGYELFRALSSERGVGDVLHNSPNIVVADEAHQFKNPDSKINRAVSDFRTTARIALTGSPLSNNVLEYHSLINWASPNYLADRKEFQQFYADPIKAGFFVDSTGADRKRARMRLKALKDTVAPKVHRRTMKVLRHIMPPKSEFVLFLPLTPLQMRSYEIYLDMVTGQSSSSQSVFQLLSALETLLTHPAPFKSWLESKVGQDGHSLPPNAICSLLEAVRVDDVDDVRHSHKIPVLLSILDEASRIGDKVLVFSQRLTTIDYLQRLLGGQKRRVYRLDGNTDSGKRQDLVQDFNKCRGAEVFLISTRAGGVGLNIHGANRVVIFDLNFNPSHEVQAIGRAYRLGQPKPVSVYWLISGGTFQSVLHDQGVFKSQLAIRVVDEKNLAATSSSIQQYCLPPKDIESVPTDEFVGKDDILDRILKSPLTNNIRKIVSTDIFEEEEPEDFLSPEELAEAERLTKMNHIRSINPKAYELERANARAIQQHSTTRHSLTATGTAGGGPPSLPSWIPGSSDSYVGSPEGFGQVLRARADGMVGQVVNIHDLISKVTGELTLGGRTGIAAMERWKLLTQAATQDEEFCIAVLKGKVSPVYMATGEFPRNSTPQARPPPRKADPDV
jgi:SNF2 family DNA or RNA helicase